MDKHAPAASVVQFLHAIQKLKTTKRTGWIDKNVKGPESISDHMHRMGIMAMLVDDPLLNRDKCVKIAIVHDLAEAVVGDITPLDERYTKEQKHAMERDAMKGFREMLGDTVVAREIEALWQEYEDAESPEALFVKDLDKFEMIVQALEYEKSDNIELQDFFNSTMGKFRHPIIKEWVEALYKEREDLKKVM